MTQPQRRNPPHLQRVPPHDLDAERQLLGAALLTLPAARAATTVNPDDYYRPAHTHIAEAIQQLVADNAQPDAGLVAATLRQQGLLDAIDGPAYLTDLIANCAGTTNADRLADIIRGHANKRRTLGLAAEIIDAVYAGADTLGVIAQLHHTSQTTALAAHTTWEPVNLARALAGEGNELHPTILARTDGAHLLYPGKVHSFVGEPESGKSWLATLAATQVMNHGGHVLCIDFEADDVTQVTRLLELGVHPDTILERFHYIRPDEPLHAAATLRITAALEAWPIELAIVDGVAEALALNGWDENKASDVTNLYVRLCRPLAARGAAVATIDHVTKDKETQGRYARGNGAKLAAIDGAVYKLEVFKPFGRGLAGAAKVIVNKDRHGHVRQVAAGGKIIGELHLDGTGNLAISLVPTETSDDGPFRPTGYMERLCRAMELHAQPVTAREARSLTSGRAQVIDTALARLVEEGHVRKIPGTGRTVLHEVIKPYREGDPT